MESAIFRSFLPHLVGCHSLARKAFVNCVNHHHVSPQLKKSFVMFYTFEARAGVDLSKAEIDVNKHNRTIDITLPAPTI